jgi:hypothetical protein
MDKIVIIDSFFNDIIYNKIKTCIFQCPWKNNRKSKHSYYDIIDHPYWSINLKNDNFFAITLMQIISAHFQKNYTLRSVYAVSQTFAETENFHNDSKNYTFCLYINNIPDESGGSFLIPIPNRNEIVSINPINNRCVLFPANYQHRGDGFVRTISDLRICITWKLVEINYDFFFTKQLIFNKRQDLINELYQVQDSVINQHYPKLDSFERDAFGKGSITTQCWRRYNLLEFNKPYINELFKEIKQTFILQFLPKEPYHISIWVNVHKKGEFLDWHGHQPISYKGYHGYYSVQSEPSTTSYKFPNIEDVYVHYNKNGLIVINNSDGDRHCVSEWKEDIDRISIAFNINPTQFMCYEDASSVPFIEEQDIVA